MEFMLEAARLAKEGVLARRGGPFGAVVVRQGTIVGRGCNRVLETADPTAHAEIEAIRDACHALGSHHLPGCVLFTTCEPCPMCLAAAHWARLDRIEYALTRADAARIGFQDEDLYAAMAEPRLPVEHVASPAAAEAFRLWEELPDRETY